MHHRVEAVRVVEGARHRVVRVASGRRLLLLVVILVAACRLLLEVWCFINLRFLQNLGLDGVRVELDVQTPLLDLLRLGNHFVELLDGVDAVLWLLEETLAHLCDGLLVLTHLLGDADKHGELRGQVDVLALLLYFKQRLAHLTDLHVVLLSEVGGHRDGGAGLTLLEIAGFRAHVEAHVADLVGLVVAVHCHDDGAFEFVNDGLLELAGLRDMVVVALTLLSEALHLIVNQLEAIINRQILADVVDDQIKAALENPGGREETRPGLHGAVEGLGLRAHEEARVAANLAQV
mmetsp:Transcript_12498/g.15983  ORF Transcript_12498/g.15983 Transcript_12498/m.15983 type:complete len:291 (-) Transcript_12498:1479-2351(-)